jgi:hypothetical protein
MAARLPPPGMGVPGSGLVGAENGSDIRITTEATFTDNGTDIVLIFGSRDVFTGITLDTTTCDKTSLLRIDNVDVTCPTS